MKPLLMSHAKDNVCGKKTSCLRAEKVAHVSVFAI